MDYFDYLEKFRMKDCRESWISWKMDVCGMSRKAAVKLSIDPEWGYDQI